MECRKFKGGYYEDSNNDTDNYCPEYKDYEIDGGKIDQSIIVEDSGNGYDREDGFERDDNWNDNQDDYDQYEDYRAENDDTDGILSGNDDTDKGKVVVDDSVPKEIQDQIDSLLSRLPAVISNQNVKIISNPELLDLILSEKGEKASGTFLHAGYVLPDGTVVKEDTVLLGNGADISTVQEELVHCWQMNNCFEDGATTNNSLSAMEFQSSVIQYIHALGDLSGPVLGPTGLDPDFADYYLNHLPYIENEDGSRIFDLDRFEEDMDGFYAYWLEYYASQDKGHPYAQGDDMHYDWNWEDLIYHYIQQ